MSADGVKHLRDNHHVFGFALSIRRDADSRALRPVQFGVARP